MKILKIIFYVLLFLTFVIVVFINVNPQFGANPNKSQKLLMQEFHEESWEKKLEISKKFIDLSTQDFNSMQRGKIYSEFCRYIALTFNSRC